MQISYLREKIVQIRGVIYGLLRFFAMIIKKIYLVYMQFIKLFKCLHPPTHPPTHTHTTSVCRSHSLF